MNVSPALTTLLNPANTFPQLVRSPMTLVRTTAVTRATMRIVVEEDAAVAEEGDVTTTTEEVEAAGTMTAEEIVVDTVVVGGITIVETVVAVDMVEEEEADVITIVEDAIMTGGTECTDLISVYTNSTLFCLTFSFV